jgi:SulP family sulfate permease
VGVPRKAFVLDFSNVSLIDSTAANTLRGFVHKLERTGTHIYFAGARPAIRKTLVASGFSDDGIRYTDTTTAALQQIKSSP